jgi:hypothetical protein
MHRFVLSAATAALVASSSLALTAPTFAAANQSNRNSQTWYVVKTIGNGQCHVSNQGPSAGEELIGSTYRANGAANTAMGLSPACRA